MNLDELLEETRPVPPMDPAVQANVELRLLTAAHADVSARARSELRRRGRVVLGGLAAAAVAAFAVTVQSNEGRSPAVAQVHPADVQFKTVAQVIDAAEAAPGPGDPTSDRYWKVVTGWKCDLPTAVSTPSGPMCQSTMFAGNGGSGSMTDATGVTMTAPEATATLNGSTYTWRQLNGMGLSDSQVRSLVADHGPGRKVGRAPSSAYMFKGAIEFLVYAPASSRIRKQLWQVIADIPGVRLDGQAKDALGRTGWRLTLDTPGWSTQSILINPTTGMPLEESDQVPGHSTNVTTVVSVAPTQTAPDATSNMKPMSGGGLSAPPTMRPVESGSNGTPPAVVSTR